MGKKSKGSKGPKGSKKTKGSKVSKLSKNSKSSKINKESKVSKEFHADGLGNLLEWIDDEILAPSDLKKLKTRKVEKPKKTKQLYGDNELVPKRRVKFELDEVKQDVDVGISDKCRGLVNRLTAKTMPFVTGELHKLYSSNNRHAVDSALFDIVEKMVICSEELTKRTLVAELMLVISYMSHTINNGIGSSFVHRLVQRFDKLYRDQDADKNMENILNCLSNLYIIGLISSNIIFEVAKRINDGPFTTKSVELMIFILKGIGFHLRQNAGSMSKLIIKTQENCKKLKEEQGESVGTRITFMIDALTAIKNNNINKLENYGCDIDTSTIESTLKGLTQRTKLQEPLSDASYEEIVRSSNWYLLETRLQEADTSKDGDKIVKREVIAGTDTTNSSKLSQKEELICKSLKLHKPAEKTIFSALNKSSDYIEACTHIMAYGMTHCSDAMSVCVQSVIHSKQYNPFYYKIICNLVQHNRRYKMGAKFAIQDRIKQLSDLNSVQVQNFRRFCFELIKTDTIPITILKAVDWTSMNDSTKAFLSWLFEQIEDLPVKERKEIMKKDDKSLEFTKSMKTYCDIFLTNCELFED